jgi:23S rRNA maturation mini-RNase III
MSEKYQHGIPSGRPATMSGKFIPTHAQQLVIIQWMDSCIAKEEEEDDKQSKNTTQKTKKTSNTDRTRT